MVLLKICTDRYAVLIFPIDVPLVFPFWSMPREEDIVGTGSDSRSTELNTPAGPSASKTLRLEFSQLVKLPPMERSQFQGTGIRSTNMDSPSLSK